MSHATPVHLVIHVDGKQGSACLGSTATEYRMFGATLTTPRHQMSGDPRAVTCEACKRTTPYAEAMKKYK